MQPLEISLQSSRLLLVALLGAHLGALVVAATMPLPVWVKVIAGFAVMGSMGYTLWRNVFLRGRDAVTVVKLTQNGMEVMLRSGTWLPVDVLGSSFVSPLLLVLHLNLATRRFMMPVVILPDTMGRDDFRKLRVWLRWSGALRHGADGAGML